MKSKLIKNALLVNEGAVLERDILIKNGRIEKIDKNISAQCEELTDAQGGYILPGVIDDQVHFREPGLTHKGTIFSESRAAVAGGVTSYIEQPNTRPAATTMELLENKFNIAASNSMANYSFNLGAANDNFEDLVRADYTKFAGIKVFMGSSTGNMLVDDEKVLRKIFSEIPHLIITHCEDEDTIKVNLERIKSQYGNAIPPYMHPIIRSEEACYLSSSFAVSLAKQYNTRLHVYHISTGKETELFANSTPLEDKRITAEACIHHLWFSDLDYNAKGNLIKWNPAVKTSVDKTKIWEALLDGRIDVVATDHAPHTLEEKLSPYLEAPSGGPLVQHSLQAMLQFVMQGRITIEKLVELMCHNPAILFRVKERGFVREGYFADLVMVKKATYKVTKDNLLYHCGWSPFEGEIFDYSIDQTWVNGNTVWKNGVLVEGNAGIRLEFYSPRA